MPRPTVLVAAAVTIHDGKVLITKRMPRADHLADVWEFPGGKVEAGEDPAIAVARECEEECGAIVEVLDIFDVTFHAYEHKDVVLLFYRCGLLSDPQAIQHHFVADHAWVLPLEIRRFGLPPADHKVLAKLEREFG